MKLPRSADDLVRFTREVVDECLISRESRKSLYRSLTSIFYTGSDDGNPAKHNRAFSHVDKLSSYLFSPAEVRFTLEFEGSTSGKWKHMAETAARQLNRNFARSKADTSFSEANVWSLVKGVALQRINWGRGTLEPWVIQPEFFGVLREDISDLDRQDAFVVTSYLTESALRRVLASHVDRDQITRLVGAAFDSAAAAEIESFGPGVSFGTGYPNLPINIPGITTPSPAAQGRVDFLSQQPSAMLAPDVASRLVRLDELWVWDDVREDYTTILFVEPGILLEGKYQRRNLTGVAGEHPFRRVCSNEVPNYFWGRSELANIAQLQRMLNARIENVDKLYRLQADPPRAFRGFSGLTSDKARALLSPGSILVDGAPSGTTSIDTFKPEIPQGYLEYISQIDRWYDEAGGFTAILSGEGEPGVRAGTHANTLLRTSTPRLRDRALQIEKQVADVGELCWHIMAAKDATVYSDGQGGEFTLGQLPDDVSVQVDSHTSSPAFSGDAEQKAFALHKAGAIGPEDLIRAVHVPMEDELISNLRSREAAQARRLEELKAVDQDAWAKAAFGSGHHR